MQELRGQRVLVLGLGLSGRSAAAYCAHQGAEVLAADVRPAAELGALSELPASVALQLGAPPPDPAEFDLVVPSPGVPRAIWARARRAWGDLELAARALSVPLVAITGTNGKSTVTRLVEALLRAAGLRAEAAGNVGRPALELVGRPLDVAVLEVSSFQLEAIERFRPRVAAILNITPDHLDRHGSFEAYVEAKARLLANQQSDDAAVLHFGDPAVRALAARTRARIWPFSPSAPPEQQSGPAAWIDAGAFVVRSDDDVWRISGDGLRLHGLAMRENVLAALAIVAALGADVARAAGALPGFEPLPHRMQPVGSVAGVRFVNDSKATNVGAAALALESCDGPVVWIAGGRDKGADFTPLLEPIARRVRAAVLIGEATPRLARLLEGHVPVHAAGDLEKAVARAAALAQPGDVVLLAPACASLDQFRNFEERGERFRACVAALGAGGGAR